jgi:T-complex protein 1 subunit eta
MGLWVVQINAITAATEAACLVLSVDETIKNPKVKHSFLAVK